MATTSEKNELGMMVVQFGRLLRGQSTFGPQLPEAFQQLILTHAMTDIILPKRQAREEKAKLDRSARRVNEQRQHSAALASLLVNAMDWRVYISATREMRRIVRLAEFSVTDAHRVTLTVQDETGAIWHFVYVPSMCGFGNDKTKLVVGIPPPSQSSSVPRLRDLAIPHVTRQLSSGLLTAEKVTALVNTCLSHFFPSAEQAPGLKAQLDTYKEQRRAERKRKLEAGEENARKRRRRAQPPPNPAPPIDLT